MMGRAALALCAALGASAAAPAPQWINVGSTDFTPMKKAWLGATLYGTGKPVGVRFIHSTAAWGNQLFYITPSGSERPLFIYRESWRNGKCPDSGGISADLGRIDSAQEVVFMMRTVSSDMYAGAFCTGEACGPRYTGLNDTLLSHWHSRGEYAHLAEHPWAEMARLGKEQIDSLPPPCAGLASNAAESADSDGVLISYNDGANESFGDLVILVTGVVMDVEMNPPRADIAPEPVAPAARVPSDCRIEAYTNGVTRGEAFASRPMDLPLSVIVPTQHPFQRPIFLDQAWRALDPRRPDETAFPVGPQIAVTTPGPFAFDLGFFSTEGQLVNRARGEVTAAMMRDVAPASDGRRTVSLMWYPAGRNGDIASTGAFVVKGWLRTLAPKDSLDPVERPVSCADDRLDLLSSFGYIRR